MFNTISNRKLFVSLLLTTASVFAGANDEAPGGSGGGNAGSNRIYQYIKMIGASKNNADATIKQKIIVAVEQLVAIPPGGEVSDQISTMAQQGLIEDIKQSRYVVNKFCADVDGVEKSASTEKINLAENPNQAHPDICINIQKLARENTTENEIVGLLMHEHARHFGLEDTDDMTGIHPIALAVTGWTLNLTKPDHISSDLVIRKEYAVDFYTSKDEMRSVQVPNFIINTRNPQKISVRLKEQIGTCGFLNVEHTDLFATKLKFNSEYNPYTTNIINQRIIRFYSVKERRNIWGKYQARAFPCEATFEIKYDGVSRFEVKVSMDAASRGGLFMQTKPVFYTQP